MQLWLMRYKVLFLAFSIGFRQRADKLGVSASEMKTDKITINTSVKENSLNSRSITPPINSTEIKITAKARFMAIKVMPTS